MRLELILQVLAGREIILIIDETGDKKKGSTTDYVKRQYIGNLGKIENGIVAVTGQKVRYNRWRPYNRIFSDGKQEKRYIQEIVFGKRHDVQYCYILILLKNIIFRKNII